MCIFDVKNHVTIGFDVFSKCGLAGRSGRVKQAAHVFMARGYRYINELLIAKITYEICIKRFLFNFYAPLNIFGPVNALTRPVYLSTYSVYTLR